MFFKFLQNTSGISKLLGHLRRGGGGGGGGHP